MTDAGLLAATIMEELAASPERLGLAVQLWPGTALYDTDPVAETAVVMDGDEEPCFCISLIGPLTAGARPQVMFLPPHGAYIVGLAADVEWRALPLNGAGGWSNYGGSIQVAEYRRGGWHTELRGVVKRSATSNPTIGTLPVGFWPETTRFLAATGAGVGVRVDVTSAGAVSLPFAVNGAVISDVTLDNVVFGIAPQ